MQHAIGDHAWGLCLSQPSSSMCACTSGCASTMVCVLGCRRWIACGSRTGGMLTLVVRCRSSHAEAWLCLAQLLHSWARFTQSMQGQRTASGRLQTLHTSSTRPSPKPTLRTSPCPAHTACACASISGLRSAYCPMSIAAPEPPRESIELPARDEISGVQAFCWHAFLLDTAASRLAEMQQRRGVNTQGQATSAR